MFSTLLFVILTWGFTGIVLVGLGVLVQRMRGELTASFEIILDSFWLGFALTVFFLQLWNLFFPIDHRSFYVLAGIGFAGILFNFEFFIGPLTRINVFLLLLIGVSVIYLAGVASAPFLRYDQGLYYSNIIQWAKSFPVVKGLGNLNGRLAYNNAQYLFAAWMECFPWIRRSHHLVTGFLFGGLFIQILYSCFKIVGSKPILRENTVDLQHIFYVLMFWPVIFFVNTSHIASPAADTAIIILEIVLFAKLLAFVEQVHSSGKKMMSSFFFMVMLLVLGICIKASMLVFGVSVLAVASLLIFSQKTVSIEADKPRVLIICAVGVLSGILPFILRNILVSGYISYPMPFGGLPVIWKIPYAHAFGEMMWDMSSARGAGDYNKVLGNMEWFRPWLFNNWNTLFSFKIPICLAAAGLIGILLYFVIHRKIQLRAESWQLFIPVLLALIAWFFSIPDVRFAGALFWILGIWLLMLAMLLWVHRPFFIKIICTFVFLSAVFYLCVETKETIGITISNARDLKINHVHVDGRMKLGLLFNDIFNDLPEGNYVEKKIDSGLIIYMPAAGESCWEKIPCTPGFDKNLRLIRAGDLASGFMVDPGK